MALLIYIYIKNRLSFAANQVFYLRYISEILRKKKNPTKTRQATFEAPTPGRTLGECVRSTRRRATSAHYLAAGQIHTPFHPCIQMRARVPGQGNVHARESAI